MGARIGASVAVTAVVALAVYAGAQVLRHALPDIRRYLRMRAM